MDLQAYYRAIAGAESGGRANARNPRSSAVGVFQFTKSTWDGIARDHPELGLTDRTDPAQQMRAMQVLTQQNMAQLSRAGIPATPGNLYGAHFLGGGGASHVLSQPDTTPVASVVGHGVVAANPFLANWSVGDLRHWLDKKAGGSAAIPQQGIAGIPQDAVVNPEVAPAAAAAKAQNGGIGSILASYAMMKAQEQQAPPPPPPQMMQRMDDDQSVTPEDTSQTPDWYKYRASRYG